MLDPSDTYEQRVCRRYQNELGPTALANGNQTTRAISGVLLPAKLLRRAECEPALYWPRSQ
jgi:hypothetical protein